MPFVIIGLGSNRAHNKMVPQEIVPAAARALCALCSEGQQVSLSPLYQSDAWPDPNEPSYVNAVATLTTSQSPEAVLAGLHAIEAGFGRVRCLDPTERYAPRTLDLDLLDYDGEVRDGPGPVLPHPRMTTRAFVLAPLLDVVPDWHHPVTGETAAALLRDIHEPGTKRL